jgi:hypothetical protein
MTAAAGGGFGLNQQTYESGGRQLQGLSLRRTGHGPVDRQDIQSIFHYGMADRVFGVPAGGIAQYQNLIAQQFYAGSRQQRAFDLHIMHVLDTLDTGAGHGLQNRL